MIFSFAMPVIKIRFMTIERFASASFDKKCDWIIKNTAYLIASKTDEGTVYLYHSGDFFIEVYYSKKQQRVTDIRWFNDIDRLTLYTLEISLAEII
jgi:hypothetical protein